MVVGLLLTILNYYVNISIDRNMFVRYPKVHLKSVTLAL